MQDLFSRMQDWFTFDSSFHPNVWGDVIWNQWGFLFCCCCFCCFSLCPFVLSYLYRCLAIRILATQRHTYKHVTSGAFIWHHYRSLCENSHILKQYYKIWPEMKNVTFHVFHHKIMKWLWLSPYFKSSVYSYWLLCLNLKYSEYSFSYTIP